MNPNTCPCGSTNLTLQQPIRGYIVKLYRWNGLRYENTSTDEVTNRHYRESIVIKCTDCLREIDADEAQLNTPAQADDARAE